MDDHAGSFQGNDRLFSALFTTEENKRIAHEKRTIFLSYSEESLRGRRGLVRGTGTLHQASITKRRLFVFFPKNTIENGKYIFPFK